MRTVPIAAWALASLLSVSAARPEASAELLDLSARIDYGFYAQERNVIQAARSSLSRLADGEPLAGYYDGLAAYRLAQLDATQSARSVGTLLEECADRGRAAAKADKQSSEAWVLLAACSTLGTYHEPIKALLHQRRLEQALERARALDPENPRIALTEAWTLSQRPAHDEPETRRRATALLQEALAQFRLWRGAPGAPEWGEAEALAHLGEIHLQSGNVREARDYIEEALLIAPDYRFALSLRKRVLSTP